MKQLLAAILLFTLFTLSCKKDSFITGPEASLSTSSDTLRFDTVFTTVGSVTQLFRIYNENDQKLRLNKVSLSGGAASAFKINVDGTPGAAVENIEIEANDSVYVFVSVKVDPTAANLPFIIRDSINIQYNGKDRWVQLEAWGQNAHFLRSRLIDQTTVWTNDKPYVILGGLQVDTNATLTIQKGCRIYLHADAPFIVDGSLQVQGEKEEQDRVLFAGDRLDEPYRNYPASWPGIYFRTTSHDNHLQYAVVKNAYQGIVAENPNSTTTGQPKITMNQCIVDNCYDAGIFGIRSSIRAQNCLISNCGKNIQLVQGGQYEFTHCTDAAFSNSYIQHKEPVLLLTDYITVGNTTFTGDLNASFRNCIFWADNSIVENEVLTDKKANGIYAVNFENCLWKVKTNPANSTTSNIIANAPPAFDTINTQRRIYNFRLKEGSPAVNKGTATGLALDLDGLPRNVGLPDLGCYERQ